MKLNYWIRACENWNTQNVTTRLWKQNILQDCLKISYVKYVFLTFIRCFFVLFLSLVGLWHFLRILAHCVCKCSYPLLFCALFCLWQKVSSNLNIWQYIPIFNYHSFKTLRQNFSYQNSYTCRPPKDENYSATSSSFHGSSVKKSWSILEGKRY